MRYCIIFLVCIGFIFCGSLEVQADPIDISEQVGLDRLSEALPEEARDLLLSSGIAPEKADSSSFENLLRNIGNGLRDTVSFPYKNLLSVFTVILITKIAVEFTSDELHFTVQMSGAAAVMILIVPSMLHMIQETVDTVNTINHFLLAAIPVYVGILTISGNPTVGSTYGSLTLATANGMLSLCTGLILPLTQMYLALSCTAAMTRLEINRVPDTLYKALKWLITISVSLFTGILSIQTLIAGQTDAVTGKAVKMVASGMVPIVGGAFSDAISIMASSISALKSGAGIFGLLGSLVLLLPTAAQICSWILVCEALGLTSVLFDGLRLKSIIHSCSALMKLLLAILFSAGAVSVVAAAVLLRVRGVYG